MNNVKDWLRAANVGEKWILCWFCFHFFALVVWILPPTAAVREAAFPLVRDYVVQLDLEQSWGMFAPNPLAEDSDLSVDFVNRRGVVVGAYQYMRMRDLGLQQRYFHERWRKLSENSAWCQDEGFQVGLVRYAARQAGMFGHVRGRLWRTTVAVPAPGAGVVVRAQRRILREVVL